MPNSLHDHYLPFLAEIDRRIGRPARIQLQEHYSFLDAWRIYKLTPSQALEKALEALEARRLIGVADGDTR
jgi:hypothetical protein